ncbi:MAG: Gfo/Idh/MocA family oxidoreductase [Pseudomonadota bacterium]
MKVVIFGLGSIGERHARLLLDGPGHEVFAFRSSKNSQPNSLGITEIHSWDEVKKIKPDAAFITNPTDLHVETALQCARLGMHLFIEKPLSHSVKDLNKLESVCKQKGLTCYIAYCLRFHPVIRKIRELIAGKEIYHARIVCVSHLPNWRKGRDSRQSYSGSKAQGGGVLLDVSHEFDYIQHIFGEIKEMQGAFGKISEVTVDAEDFADVLITLENSIRINLHLDLFSLKDERTIKVAFKGGYLIADLINSKIICSYQGKEEIFDLKTGRDLYLRDQLNYFLENIGASSIMNDISEARPLLEKILEFKNA